MTCKDLMTSSPSCCVPGDSVATAAQTMKREDVGPVLVVADHSDNRLVGIVTDRDLALKVVAEGRDPHNTRIDQVMSAHLVTCREDEDVSAAMKRMADHQVRRIPVVDASGRVSGIISQADIALQGEEEQVGEMVEEISQPYGTGEWAVERFEEAEPKRGSGGVSTLAIGALCIGVGAGLMFLLDPSRGRRRRAILRDKASSYAGSSAEMVRKTTDDLKNRATGAYSATKSRLQREQIPDEKLVGRIRAKMGRCLSNPHAVQVTANGGHVTLTGSVLADEVKELVKCVRSLPGVQSFDNFLEVHEASENHPTLQAHREHHPDGGWGPTMRLLSGAVGGSMMLYGLRSRSAVGKASASVGLGLLTRGLTNREFGRIGEIASLRGLKG